ncbi:MAG: hypothetical protein AAGN82_25995 [Myxococcota bacterium]
MSRWGVIAAVVVAFGAGTPATARADEPRAADHFLPEWISVGVGGVGQVGINVLDEPGDQSVDGGVPTPGYPGFFGVHAGGGFALDVRFLGYVGFEMDVLYTRDRGRADITITNFTSNTTNEFGIEIGHGAVHVPLLLKGALPGRFVTPVVFLGPEFVLPNEGELEIVDGNNNSGSTFTAFSEDYTFLTFGFGMEINLPIPKVDLRIPIQLRGSFNPGVSDVRTERSRVTTRVENDDLKVATESYQTGWQWQVAANVGLMWHF